MGRIGKVIAFTIDVTKTNVGVINERIDSPFSIISTIVLGFNSLRKSMAKGAMAMLDKIIDATDIKI